MPLEIGLADLRFMLRHALADCLSDKELKGNVRGRESRGGRYRVAPETRKQPHNAA
jgi:hypothetical protein